MQKLKLDLNLLKVESFNTQEVKNEKGTVLGADRTPQCSYATCGAGCETKNNCQSGAIPDTCNMVCMSYANCTTDDQLLCDIRTKAHLTCEINFC